MEGVAVMTIERMVRDLEFYGYSVTVPPTGAEDKGLWCNSCQAEHPHRFRPSPEAWGWRCSECGEEARSPAPLSPVVQRVVEAWAEGKLSEGVAADILGLDRVDLRRLRYGVLGMEAEVAESHGDDDIARSQRRIAEVARKRLKKLRGEEGESNSCDRCGGFASTDLQCCSRHNIGNPEWVSCRCCEVCRSTCDGSRSEEGEQS